MTGCDRRHAILATAGLARAAPALFATPASGLRHRADLLHVERQGNGPDVVLIAGLGTSWRIWSRTVVQLRARCRVHAVQLRGFADVGAIRVPATSILDAAATEITAVLARMPRPAKVIAHSGGGAMALKATLQGAAHLSSLMLVDSAPSPGDLRAPRAATSEDIRRSAQAAFDQVMRASAGERAALLSAEAMSAVKDPRLGHQIAQWYVSSDRELLARATLELTTTDLRPRLPNLAVPCTVVHADQASLGAPPGWMRSVYQRQYAGAGSTVQMVEVADARHFLMLDQPDAFAAAVEAFVS